MWYSGVQGSSGTSARFRSVLIHATDFSQVLKVPLLVSGPLWLAISGGEGEGASAFAMSRSFFCLGAKRVGFSKPKTCGISHKPSWVSFHK